MPPITSSTSGTSNTPTSDSNTHDFEPAPKISVADLNQKIINAEYAVRGSIAMRAEELEFELYHKTQPHSFPFERIIYANIGNPQQLDQKPLTFSRQVMSILEYPGLLKFKDVLLSQGIYKKDALERAELLQSQIGASVGAYSLAQGVYGIRETTARFISKRDNCEAASADDIFLTDGASKAVTYLMMALCQNEHTGILIPIPQYPLYTASICIHNAKMLPYYLDEESGWSTKVEEIENSVINAIENGIKPSAMVVINPGNPTGAVLSVDVIQRIITVAAKYGIVLIADEVYQDNIFNGEFHSMKKILRQLQKKYPGKYDNVQLASLHSTSKGVSGECGQRGGYMEIVGFSDEVRHLLLKLASINICSVVTGQALVDLMVDPPHVGDESYEKDQEERNEIHSTLKKRADKLYDTFSNLEGIECQKPQGAMYLFPRLILPDRAIEEAKKLQMEADEFYCHKLLENTGICTVPGSGFGQREGTYHVRTTFLSPGTEWIDDWKKFHEKFMKEYQ
ncbi:hypothetical protein KAFR_0B05520 [Kazachstania africana CBS 2517]|uniref:Aminotransferase class I/classII large domain-containing protein n=1 Tax=Kazachstania africana (strain ATCC 22294 / BCRC 22015 / CBS 2517 / CECT 1963 / NBRC 1671 / NRRL Y-8276) TaxID=1071382 RepID=H2AR47_KAZAF|nr:hypothetical protein KAFR_0B05520 [Kazachstania africana CBS 2517]CCF56847.1 hypothetical protein KAFR_0B05520 [Kazachstania africana CBS 2517]